MLACWELSRDDQYSNRVQEFARKVKYKASETNPNHYDHVLLLEIIKTNKRKIEHKRKNPQVWKNMKNNL